MRRRALLLAAAAGMVSTQTTGFLHAAERRRVAILLATNAKSTQHLLEAFTSRMRELGWVEGKNIEYLVRYAEGQAARFAPIARDLLGGNPDVLFAPYGPAALAAMRHGLPTPIVFALTIDPVAMGLVTSLARPGGTATGVSTRGEEVIAKRLELLREIVPSVRRLGLVITEDLVTRTRTPLELAELQRAAGRLGIEIVVERHGNKDELGRVIDRLKRSGVDAIWGMPEQYAQRAELVAHAIRAKLPGSYNSSEYVEAGGLFSLAPSFPGRYRQAANYVDKILRGARPAELPVEQASTLELTLNLSTAKALGIAMAPGILLRADRVIE